MERLPVIAHGAVRWAAERVLANDMAKTDVLSALNGQLADNRLGPISKSAFSRWALGVRAGRIRPPGAPHTNAPGTPTISISPETATLLAIALRSLADDLDKLAGAR